jgi:plastocyanin
MSDATIFYILGGALAALALVTSLSGLRFQSFPGRFAPLVFIGFLLLAGTAITFAIRNGQNEERARAAETKPAGEEIEEAEEEPISPEQAAGGSGGGASGGAAGSNKGPGGTVKLEASPTALAYEQKTLTSKPGKVTIDFSNPAQIEHDVAIESGGGEEIAVSKLISKGQTSVSANLPPGTYTFFCTVPGHREAGMEGTLTVK